MDQIAGSAAKGVDSLWNIAPIVTIETLIILALLYCVRALLLDAKNERTLYRVTLEKNTEAFYSLKEIIRVAISDKS